MKDAKNTKLIDLIEDSENQTLMLQELICFRKVKSRNSNDIKNKILFINFFIMKKVFCSILAIAAVTVFVSLDSTPSSLLVSRT